LAEKRWSERGLNKEDKGVGDWLFRNFLGHFLTGWFDF